MLNKLRKKKEQTYTQITLWYGIFFE